MQPLLQMRFAIECGNYPFCFQNVIEQIAGLSRLSTRNVGGRFYATALSGALKRLIVLPVMALFPPLPSVCLSKHCLPRLWERNNSLPECHLQTVPCLPILLWLIIWLAERAIINQSLPTNKVGKWRDNQLRRGVILFQLVRHLHPYPLPFPVEQRGFEPRSKQTPIISLEIFSIF